MDRALRRRTGMLHRMDMEWRHYLVYARAALTKEIRQGNLLYLGDDGQALLYGFPTVLNLQVATDMEYRVDNLLERTDYVIGRKKTRQMLERIAEKAARWRSAVLDDRYRGPSGFDLVLEPGRVRTLDACDLVCDALELPQYGIDSRTLGAIDALTVAAELRARIAMIDDVVDDDVDVEVEKGLVVITGSVRSTRELDEIRELLDRPSQVRNAAGS